MEVSNDCSVQLKKEQIQQIEEWTNMKIGNIIFDSDIDNWNKNTSVLHLKVINKSNLIFLIEDVDGNLFGGYVNAKIERYNDWINDPNAFVFSLQSNGRLNGMLKFDIIKPQDAFYLNGHAIFWLFAFGIGNDIAVCKNPLKNESFCKQESYNYVYGNNLLDGALCGKPHRGNFTPKRIVVIQLI